jgi:release factor glutamine methyltransferase
MAISNWLAESTALLAMAGITTARLDALVLLEDCLHKDRALLLAHPEIELTPEQINVLGAQLQRRKAHEPLAYIRGRTEFYGREFIISNNVLEPRPESETMIDLLKTLPDDAHNLIIDVGTGSGALAVTAKCELRHNPVMAIDIDPACLAVADRNARKHKADVAFQLGNLLEPLAGNTEPILALLCNLPYVPDSFHINQAAGHEPKLAIFGGTDGLDLYRQLFMQVSALVRQPVYILTESLPDQHAGLVEIAAASGYDLTTTDDFILVFTSSRS